MAISKDQEALLELLVNVKEFLDDNGITFYLFGGSCIGALRHHGFIPWDDDIDIIMDRENYEKLIVASENMKRDDMEFWCFEKSDDYFKPFGQFSSKKNTYFMNYRIFNRGLCMGTIIDVFVLDYVPSDRLDEHKKNLLLYEEVLGFYRLHRDEIAQYKDEYFALIEKERQEGRHLVVAELQEQVEKYNEEESDLLVTRFWVRKLRQYKKEWFGEPRYCEFEGHMMPVPCKAEATLRLQYGYDWYMLPEEDNRYYHEFYVNHEISNNNYVEDAEQFFDTSNIAELFEKRKHYQIERLAQQVKLRKYEDQLKRKRLILELEPAIKANNYEALNPIIKDIGVFKNSDERKRIPQETLIGWLKWLLNTGRFFDAAKLADVFLDGSKLTSKREDELDFINCIDCDFNTIDQVVALINQLLLLAVAYQDRDMNGIEKILSSIPESMQKQIPDCLITRSVLAISKKKGISELEKELLLCQRYLNNYPENYDVMKIEGDLLVELNQNEEAQHLYDSVCEKSRNGLDVINLYRSCL